MKGIQCANYRVYILLTVRMRTACCNVCCICLWYWQKI